MKPVPSLAITDSRVTPKAMTLGTRQLVTQDITLANVLLYVVIALSAGQGPRSHCNQCRAWAPTADAGRADPLSMLMGHIGTLNGSGNPLTGKAETGQQSAGWYHT